MLNLYLYHHSQQFFNEQWMSQVQVDSKQKILVVTPSPNIADLFRSKIVNLENYEVVTISSFLADYLAKFVPEQTYTSKSEILLSLAAVWRKFFPDESYDIFLRSYNLLSDLRSFTLDPSITQTVLDEYDPIFAKAIPIFNQMIELQGWLDEHQAYFELSQRLRTQENLSGSLSPCTIFWGFKFMAGSQIDFIKALSIWSEVIIAFPHAAFEQCLETDWVKWLLDQKSRVHYADSSEQVTGHTLNVVTYPKKHLSFSLQNYLTTHAEKKIAFVLGNKRLSSHEVLEIPIHNLNIKIPVQILNQKIQGFSFLLEQKLDQQNLALNDLIAWMKQIALDSMKKQDFQMIKVTTLAHAFVSEWSELSEQHTDFGEFEKNLMLDIMLLNAPRNNLISQYSNKDISVHSIFELEAVNQETFKIIIANGDYQGIESRGQNFSENVEKYLVSIGPIRRAELEFDLLKQSFDESLAHGNAVIFMESHLLEHSLEWRNLLDGHDLIMDYAKITKKSIDYGQWTFQSEVFNRQRISASRLQDFYDCQAKFYFKYVKKISPNVKISSELQNSDLGSLEHKIIEEYLKLKVELNHERLLELAHVEMKKYLTQEMKMVTQTEYAKYMQELVHYSFAGLKMVFALRELLGTNEHFPEYEFKLQTNDMLKNGSIDLMLNGPNTLALLDFKRTGFSIPSKSELERFDKLQLWFYLNVLKTKEIWNDSQKNTIGYLNLSKPSESLIITNDQDIIAQIKGHEAFEQIRSVYYFDEQWLNRFNHYQEFEISLLQSYQEIKSYKVAPRDADVCGYCPVSLVCPKQIAEEHHVEC